MIRLNTPILVFITLLIVSLTLVATPASAKKTALKLKVDKKAETVEEQQLTRGSFMVASQCIDCNNGYRIDSISFTGFDKPGSSAIESFFITNHTDRTMTGVALYIEYLNPDGRQLHKKYLKLDCNIPAGETRKVDIKSWDTQKSFHYEKSAPSRTSSPFYVKFDPVAFWLRF